MITVIQNMGFAKLIAIYTCLTNVDQHINVCNQICQPLNERQSTCIGYCDRSKVFDRGWQIFLILNLKH